VRTRFTAHRGGRDLVLADRDPRPAQARVAQPNVDEDDQQDHRTGPTKYTGFSSSGYLERLRVTEVDLVDRGDPLAAVGEVRAADTEDAARRVLEDARHDLAERERHDRQVVAAQAQGRRAEDHAPDARERGGDEDDDEEVDVMPGTSDPNALFGAREDVDALPPLTSGLLRANQPMTNAPIA
jgi:hypothetical protein